MESGEVPVVFGLKILRKLHDVMKDCAYIQKDKENSFHKYKYASEAAIKEKLHEALVTHGVLPQFSIIAVTEREIPKPPKEGKPAASEWATTAQLHYRFIDIESGESIEGTFFGCGVDQADKGIYKATTGAIKYILTSQFLIATGDDPEGDAKPAKEKPAPRSAPHPETGSGYRPKPASQSAPASASQPKNFDMLSAFSTVKADLKRLLRDDDRRYYEVLGAHGYEKSSGIRTRDEAVRIYNEMRAIVKEKLAEITK